MGICACLLRDDRHLASLTLSLCLSLEEMCVELSRAIEAGDPQAASVCAASLARKQMALRIQPSEKNYEDAEIK